MPIGAYALAASRHMHEFGTTPEQLAQIAVDTRAWATKNPNARFQDPLTIDEVLASELVCTPLHKLDCCLQTDGAGAFVMVSAERAKDLAKPPVYVLGAGSSTTHSIISQMPDLTTTGTAHSGAKAMAMAGVGHDDVDLLMLYDSFTITTLLLLEDLGFCKKGEGGAFVEDGRLGPGGALPTNTNGGGLSYTHPGMYGMFLIVEAVRQLRGEGGDRQVPDCDIAIASGSGGVLSSMSTAVLGTEASL
jgi:acetyl-CoA acetyltransferase